MFGQIYDWAGEVRTVQIAKGSTGFCRAEHIPAEGVRIFSELRADKYLSEETSQPSYIAKLAHYYSELNVLHPFREGNGRTIRTFLSILAYESRSMAIDWNRVTPNQNIEACIQAYRGNEELLTNLLDSITFEIDK